MEIEREGGREEEEEERHTETQAETDREQTDRQRGAREGGREGGRDGDFSRTSGLSAHADEHPREKGIFRAPRKRHFSETHNAQDFRLIRADERTPHGGSPGETASPRSAAIWRGRLGNENARKDSEKGG